MGDQAVPALVFCSIRVTLGSEFRVLVLCLSMPNRVWDAMGSPCRSTKLCTFLVVAQADLPFEPRVCAWFRGQQILKQTGSVRTVVPG